MPEVPEGARQPQDRQSAAIKPVEKPDGWDLLRPPIDLEFWEVTDFTSMVMAIPTRGNQVELTAEGLRAVGGVVKSMQEIFAVDSMKFREWLRTESSFEKTAEKVLPLIFAYAGELGEVLSSEK